jgi:hypothetical protein
MSLQASRILAPGIHHDPGSLPLRSPAIPGSIWVPRIIKEPFVENIVSNNLIVLVIFWANKFLVPVFQ